MKMNKFLGAALAALLSTSALAQVNVVPQVGVNSAVITRPTYSSVALSLTPAAAATDIACIAGTNVSKNIFINHISVSGTAGTLITVPIVILRRASADTGGTAASTTANWANTILRNDSFNGAPAATLISYSANPTINDTSPTYLRSRALTLPTTGAGTVISPASFDWETTSFGQRPVLHNASEQLCINLNGSTISSGVLQLSIEWTEE